MCTKAAKLSVISRKLNIVQSAAMFAQVDNTRQVCTLLCVTMDREHRREVEGGGLGKKREILCITVYVINRARFDSTRARWLVILIGEGV